MTTVAIIMTIVMFFLKIIGIPFMATIGWWTVFMPVIIMAVFWLVVLVIFGSLGAYMVSR